MPVYTLDNFWLIAYLESTIVSNTGFYDVMLLKLYMQESHVGMRTSIE